MSLCISNTSKLTDKDNQLIKNNKLSYCSWHSGKFPTYPEEPDFFGYFIDNRVDGFDVAQSYRFIWDHSTKNCYDNCNYKNRMDDFTNVIYLSKQNKIEIQSKIDQLYDAINQTSKNIPKLYLELKELDKISFDHPKCAAVQRKIDDSNELIAKSERKIEELTKSINMNDYEFGKKFAKKIKPAAVIPVNKKKIINRPTVSVIEDTPRLQEILNNPKGIFKLEKIKKLII